MNAFPEDYVVHNLPFVLLSGLESESTVEQDGADHSKTLLREGGFRIKTDIPPLSDPTAETLLGTFLESDACNSQWNGRSTSGRGYGGGFRIRSVGRTYTLPPRKALPPPRSPRLSPTSEGPPVPLVLHSTISPLTPNSPLYPDGIITPVWITKHQTRLPAVYITFFNLSADPNVSSLQDNKLKSEINNIRSVLASTSYKTKLVVFLLGKDSIPPTELEERLSNIRRSSNLDGKSLYFLPSGSSRVEIAEFVRLVLSTLHPICVEYYRDLSKHARRKRNRGSIPLPTIYPNPGTSHILPLQGWNARYEFKLGVFAEFRQEMDAACRNYESAYESLFALKLFGSTASWSPRFNEARMLADIIAIRIIRCQLWTEQPTGAVRSWVNHRDRMREMIDRKGKGTNNYGWEAWESVWSKAMAEMVARVELPSLSILDAQSQRITSIFASPEKALPLGERIAPWDLLHHRGYWLVNAWKHVQKRRQLATQIPEEDRAPPKHSPASVIASKAHVYDGYLTPEPFAERPLSGESGYDYTGDVVTSLLSAMEPFSATGQFRMVERLQLEEAIEYISSAAWTKAAPLLIALWNNSVWRSSGWWNFLAKIGWALFDCATHMQDQNTIVRLSWELSSRIFEPHSNHRCDLHQVLSGFEAIESRPTVVMSSHEAACSVMPTFAFGRMEGNVGQPMEIQLCLISQLRDNAAPLNLSEVKIVFEGVLRPVHLVHDEATCTIRQGTQILSVTLQDSSTFSKNSKKRASAGAIASLLGSTDLMIGPGDIKVYTFSIVPREAGDVKISSVTLIIEDERFSLTLIASALEEATPQWWEMQKKRAIARSLGMERDTTTVKILPKPPMIRIVTPNLKQTYYTNEAVALQIDILNEEEETATASVEARLISPRKHAATIRWSDVDRNDESATEQNPTDGTVALSHRDIGSFSPSSSTSFSILAENTLDAIDHELEITVRYYLTSDPDTPLVKTTTTNLSFIRPFEANYHFAARIDRDEWPNFFGAPELHSSQTASGLKQQYEVVASLCSFASEQLLIQEMDLHVQEVIGEAVCQTSSGHRKTQLSRGRVITEQEDAKIIAPNETQDICFDLAAQQLTLGARQTVGLDLLLRVTWRRLDSSETATSTLEIPRFVAPMAEPRVLLTNPVTLSQSPGTDLAIYQLMFTLENPSMHFLTFNLTMESSEDFAFSGLKSTSLSLVPISRHTVEYRLLPNKKGEWIGVNLGVVDAYFGKTLRVIPAGDGVKSDKKGNISIWVP